MTTFRTSAAYDAVICDIDGCLTPEAPGPFDVAGLALISDYNRLAVELRDRPLLTLCSGRPVSYVEALCRLLHNPLLPAIAENGVWLYDPFRNVAELDPAITPEQLEIVRAASDLLTTQFGKHGLTLQAGKAASVTLFHPEHQALVELLPHVEREVRARQWPFRVSITWYYLNCDLPQISKGTGVRRLLSQAGIPAQRTLGIGDTAGDKAIAHNVSFFACPENAAAELKSIAGYVSSFPEVAGVWDILQRFALPG